MNYKLYSTSKPRRRFHLAAVTSALCRKLGGSALAQEECTATLRTSHPASGEEGGGRSGGGACVRTCDPQRSLWAYGRATSVGCDLLRAAIVVPAKLFYMTHLLHLAGRARPLGNSLICVSLHPGNILGPPILCHQPQDDRPEPRA